MRTIAHRSSRTILATPRAAPCSQPRPPPDLILAGRVAAGPIPSARWCGRRQRAAAGAAARAAAGSGGGGDGAGRRARSRRAAGPAPERRIGPRRWSPPVGGPRQARAARARRRSIRACSRCAHESLRWSRRPVPDPGTVTDLVAAPARPGRPGRAPLVVAGIRPAECYYAPCSQRRPALRPADRPGAMAPRVFGPSGARSGRSVRSGRGAPASAMAIRVERSRAGLARGLRAPDRDWIGDRGHGHGDGRHGDGVSHRDGRIRRCLRYRRMRPSREERAAPPAARRLAPPPPRVVRMTIPHPHHPAAPRPARL
jgi:hypothetical protein